jgi:hypothetical protein
MRVMVMPREYSTQEIAARVFGNRRASGGYASGGVTWLEDPAPPGDDRRQYLVSKGRSRRHQGLAGVVSHRCRVSVAR